MPAHDPAAMAAELESRILALADPSTDTIRRERSEMSRRIRSWPGELVIDAALRFRGERRWVGYELVHHHDEAMALLDADTVLRFAPDVGSSPGRSAPSSFGTQRLSGTSSTSMRAASPLGSGARCCTSWTRA